MTDLKLRRLPDRVPVRLTIMVQPKLHKALQLYADLYREIYGEEESVQTLIPYMLQDFLNTDRAFARASNARKAKETAPAIKPRRAQERAGTEISPSSS